MIQVTWKELNYVQFDRRAIRSAFGKAARTMAGNLRKTASGGGGGVTYRIGGRSHTASTPGGPPARFTGNLVRSMKGRASRRGYALVVSAIAPHAHLLELGARHMAARPAFAPVFADRSLILGLLQTAYAQAPVGTPGSPGAAPRTVEIN